MLISLQMEADERPRARPEEFIHIFINSEEWLVRLLEYVLEKDSSPHSSAVYDTLLELYLQDDVREKQSNTEPNLI